ncbi:SDR family oxidoreductase [Hamadaea sp. NPDC051192]|uniref:SDR family NAD(P)-dependent oxidoreductase n=1 Tax=Hamadaea sp. NPDC051192 TaxID=3154940 RepID=UPI0034313EB3
MTRTKNPTKTAIVVGSSDGIGLALATRLVSDGWRVIGVSRSPGGLTHTGYEHLTLDVIDSAYAERLAEACDRLGAVDLCVYCAGIGDFLRRAAPPADLAADLAVQSRVLAVNLGGAAATVEVVLPLLAAARSGHFIGLSSLADRLISDQAPAYAASKAGLTSYLDGLALAMRPYGVAVTTVRFGFVDTKLAKSPVTPFKISPDRAAELILRCVRRRPARLTAPKRMAALVWLVARITAVRLRLGR